MVYGELLNTAPWLPPIWTTSVVINKKDIKTRKNKLVIGVYSGDKLVKTVKANFFGPINNN
jgi:hypothetical protein